jgi:hypothetical protein
VSPPEARRRQLSRPEPAGTQAPFSRLRPTYSRNRPSAGARIQARGAVKWIGSKPPLRCTRSRARRRAPDALGQAGGMPTEECDHPGGRADTDHVMPRGPFNRETSCIHVQSLAGQRLRPRRAAAARSATPAGRRRPPYAKRMRRPTAGPARSPPPIAAAATLPGPSQARAPDATLSPSDAPLPAARRTRRHPRGRARGRNRHEPFP